MKYGRTHEDVAVKKYSNYMVNINREVHISHSGLVIRPDVPYLGCPPDRKIIDKSNHPHYDIMEVKCSHKYKLVTPTEAAQIGDPMFSPTRD